MDLVFNITDADRKKYLQVLCDFFKYMNGMGAEEADKASLVAFDNLIHGNDLSGSKITNSILNTFDDRLSHVTKSFYSPTKQSRAKYPVNNAAKKTRAKSTEPTLSTLTTQDNKDVDRIKTNLIAEYPNLDRTDLRESVYNYCVLSVKLKKLMAGDVVANNIAIKNLNDTLIKLGGYLGIDESLKAKQRAAEDKQSIAAMSVVFQQTIEEHPEIMERMRYKELRILLEKYRKGELSELLFALPSFAGCSVQAATDEVNSLASKYEAK